MRTVLLILALTSFHYCFSQIDNYYLGNCGNEYAEDIELINNDIFIVGSTNSYDWGKSDIMVLKNNGIYRNIWTKTFRGNQFHDAAKDLKIINDNTIICIGSYYCDNSNQMPSPFITKMDTSGNVIWSKVLNQASLDNSPVRVLVTKSSEYIILLEASPNSDESCYSKYFNVPHIVKLNNNGIINQSKLFYIGPEYNSEFPFHSASDIIAANDSGYIITGTTYSYKYPYVLKIDNNLNYVWHKVFRYDNWIYKTNNIIMVDDGYIILGQDDGRVFVGAPFLLKVDFNGNLKWFKVYTASNNNEFQTKYLTKNGNLLYLTAARRYWYSGSSVDYYNYVVMCTNLSGDVIWSKELGDNKSYNMPNKVVSYKDTLYLIGTTNTNALMNSLSPLSGQLDLEFIKIDTTLEYMNQFQDIEFQTTSMNLELLNYPFQFCNHNISSDNAGLIERKVSLDYDSIQCKTVGIGEIKNKNNQILNIYPNPCSKNLFISSDINNSGIGSLQIIDISGKVLIWKNHEYLPVKINLDSLEKGIYILKVEIEKQIIIRKVIKN